MAPTSPTPKPFKVLIVDDIPLMRTMLTKYVTTLGKTAKASFGRDLELDVAEACNGNQALDFLEKEKADLIFLDLMMPEMDGMTFLTHRKDDPELQKIPVVVCSAVVEEDSAIRARNLGADDYITKPFSLRTIESKLRDFLDTGRSND